MIRAITLVGTLLLAALAAGCSREGSPRNPVAPGEAEVQVTGTLAMISDGRAWDGELLLEVEVGAGATLDAYRPGFEAPSGGHYVPFESEAVIAELVAGDRVRIEGYMRGSRLLMTRLQRLPA